MQEISCQERGFNCFQETRFTEVWARNERLFWRVCREFGKLYSGDLREIRLQINSQIIITDKRTEVENISTGCQDTAPDHLSISYRC